MLKKLFMSALLLWGGFYWVQAQPASTGGDKISHHLGLQINPLLQQVINFGNSPMVDNPFLLKYSLRFNQSRKELMLGLGYQFDQQTTKNGLKSDNSQLSIRAGYSKKIALGKKFEVGIGGDLVVKARNTQTINVQSVSFQGFLDSTITTSKSTVIGYGIGPQLTLSYYLTDRILIGTEATYYLISSTEKLEVQSKNFREDNFSPLVQTTETEKDESTTTDFSLQLPVALFLIIVF